jgi:hypothetical protein
MDRGHLDVYWDTPFSFRCAERFDVFGALVNNPARVIKVTRRV